MWTESPESTPSLDTDHALSVLGDRTCREIIEKTLSEPLTARELVERCEGSRSTVYRKLETLVESGFLTRTNRIRTDGKNATQFEVAVDSVRVEFTEPEGVRLEGVPRSGDSDSTEQSESTRG